LTTVEYVVALAVAVVVGVVLVLLACPPDVIAFGVAVVAAVGVASFSTRCVFIRSVVDCGTAVPHAEQTASGATSTFPAIPSDLRHPSSCSVGTPASALDR
jgi:hypothetical protein